MKAMTIALMASAGVLGLPLANLAQPLPVSDSRPALPYPMKIKPVTTCGDVDDAQHVERYDGTLGVDKQYVKSNEPSTVQLQWLSQTAMQQKLPGYSYGNVAGERWCTGTLISAAQVLTAGHCFDVQQNEYSWVSPFRKAADGTFQFAPPATLATLQVANFHYQIDAATGAPRQADVYPIVKLVEHRDGGLDYAIVELGPNAKSDLPSKSYPPAVVLTRAPVAKETMAVIQHPQGDPKKIEAGHVLIATSDAVYYDDVDTQGGSSGSGVREAGGAVVAVHTNGGCTKTGGANRGVPTAAISAVSKVF